MATKPLRRTKVPYWVESKWGRYWGIRVERGMLYTPMRQKQTSYERLVSMKFGRPDWTKEYYRKPR